MAIANPVCHPRFLCCHLGETKDYFGLADKSVLFSLYKEVETTEKGNFIANSFVLGARNTHVLGAIFPGAPSSHLIV